MSTARTNLVEKAATAVSRGKYARALKAYVELETLEPRDGAWPRRCGEMHRHLGKKSEAIESFGRCVEKYAEAGFLVKAIAVCKLILRIDAGDKRAQRKLEELTAERFQKPTRRPLSPTGTPTIRPGAPLEEVRLRDTVPGATTIDEDERITLIPIDEDERITLIPIDEPAVGADSGDSPARWGEALRETALFEGLAAADLGLLVNGLILREVSAGETVFSQGDRGAELYVIDEGEVRVVTERPDGERAEICRLSEGDFFGEVALIAETPRSATVEAVTQCELLVLDRAAIAALVESDPRVLTLLLRFVRDRLLAQLTSSHQLLASFNDSERAELAAKFELLEIEEGANLIVEGKPSHALYVVLAGSLEVSRGAKHIAELGVGAVSGEMSLLTAEPAIATVRAKTKGFLVRLGGSEFRQLIMTHPQVLAYIAELVESRRELLAQIESADGVYSNPQLEIV